MPCSDNQRWGDDEEHLELVKIKKRNDELARMLCGLCREIEWQHIGLYGESIEYFDKVPGLREWWEEHKKYDIKEGRRDA